MGRQPAASLLACPSEAAALAARGCPGRAAFLAAAPQEGPLESDFARYGSFWGDSPDQSASLSPGQPWAGCTLPVTGAFSRDSWTGARAVQAALAKKQLRRTGSFLQHVNMIL